MFTPALIDGILDTAPVARLAQIDNHGHAQALPFVFARVGSTLWSPVDGKPKKHARLSRLAWIAEHAEVCVLIDHYCADWSRLWWMKLFCRAEVHRDGHREWEQAETALIEKYPQYAETPLYSGDPTMIRFECRKRKSWSADGGANAAAWLEAEMARKAQ
jgi:PPOX class probable F420-dependent enzyme